MKVPKFSLAQTGEASVAVLHLRHKKSDHLTKTFTWIDHPGILAATQGCVFFSCSLFLSVDWTTVSTIDLLGFDQTEVLNGFKSHLDIIYGCKHLLPTIY